MHQDNETQRILREAEKRKQKAKDFGLPELIWNLYQHLRYATYGVPDGISKDYDYISELVGKVGGKDCYEISFQFMKRNFKVKSVTTRHSFDDDNWQNQLVTLLEDGKKLFKVNVNGAEMGESFYTYTKWTPGEAEAFIEGDWIQIIKSLVQKIEEQKAIEKKAEEKEARERQAKKLKENFGI